MKIIKDKRVYDMSYGEYETIAELPAGWKRNEVGNLRETMRELRRDRASGLLYVCTQTGGYSRSEYDVLPVTRDEAMKLAEDFLDYDDYVKFFGDPEGADKGLERERDAALAKAKNTESSKDFWYKRCDEHDERIRELEKRIAELEAQ